MVLFLLLAYGYVTEFWLANIYTNNTYATHTKDHTKLNPL